MGNDIFDKPTPTTYKPYLTPEPRHFEGANLGTLDYDIGDTVKHVKFGEGIVTNITKGGRDYEVTVEFPNYGVKKLLSTFAKLVKVN